MLPKNLQRRTMMQRLHLFPEDVSSHTLRLFSLTTGYPRRYREESSPRDSSATCSPQEVR
uniref:Uncharacterized protein n=1 Tax=Cairina moschata TaxID=8855 RepID=A0A8C3BIB2_CAIMO